MFAKLALSPDENIAGAFISFSEMLECCSLYFYQKIANCVIKLSNFGLQKSLVKLLKLRISRAVLMSAINLPNFIVLIKR